MVAKNSHSRRLTSLLLLLGIMFPQEMVLPCYLSLRSTVATTTAPTGSHCLLKYASSRSEQRDEHQCPMHGQRERQQRQELRCSCCPSPSPASPSDISVVRFLLPRLITGEVSLSVTRLYISCDLPILAVALAPPNPPPRACSLMS
jgi:hypothetical protein